jgi:hypothetical protein
MQGYLSRISDAELRELGELMLKCRLRARAAVREHARSIIGQDDSAVMAYRRTVAMYKEFSEISRDIAAVTIHRSVHRAGYEPRHARPQ